MDRRSFLANALRGSAAVSLYPVASTTRSGQPRTLSAVHPPDPAAGPPADLVVNGLVSPVGVDPDELFFGWRMVDSRRGARQLGYRVVVTPHGAPTGSSPVWDSGEVASARQAFVPYGGPALDADTAYRWTVSVRDTTGAWTAPSAPGEFMTGLRTADWTAQWLQPGVPLTGPEAYTYVRTVADLPSGAIARAVAYVAAAHKYQLWVNGTEADTGPSFCYPDEQYYQATDVTSLVTPGRRNGIGVLHHWYGPGQGRPESAPGLLVQLSVQYRDGRREAFGSGAGWRARAAEWQPAPQRNSDVGDFVEVIDGSGTPLGWSEAGFDDSSWSGAPVVGPVGSPPFTNLYALRTRITEHPVSPVSVRTLASGAVVADFGKVYAARPEVRFDKGIEGRPVAMRVGYLLDDDGHVSSVHGTQGTDLSFGYVQRDGAQTFRPFTFLGFRYLEVDAPGEQLSAGQLVAVARHTAMPKVQPASFTSSNPTLDAVWSLNAHSGLYTSHEQFVDTPTREKGQFLWDASNESQVVMRAYGDQNLTWQALRDFARSQARYWPDGRVNAVYPNDDGARDFPSFTAMYPEWVWRYYLSTGDLQTLESLYPVVQRVAGYLSAAIDPATGLVTGLTEVSGSDTSYGYDFTTNVDTTINILAANVFNRVAEMAALLGDQATATAQGAAGASLARAINAHLTRPDGVYVDGLEAGGAQSQHASQQANASALAYGVVPPGKVGAVAAFVRRLGISVGPEHGLELLRALHAGGLDAAVVETLTNSSVPGWAHILAAGGTFTWETWKPSDLVGDSMSHGWGSSALVAMQESLLGVSPVAQDAAGQGPVLMIKPPFGALRSASGRVPTVAGTLQLSWARSARSFGLSLVVPPNASARVVLPAAGTAHVTESGRPVSRATGVRVVGVSRGAVKLEVAAGSYRFESAEA